MRHSSPGLLQNSLKFITDHKMLLHWETWAAACLPGFMVKLNSSELCSCLWYTTVWHLGKSKDQTLWVRTTCGNCDTFQGLIFISCKMGGWHSRVTYIISSFRILLLYQIWSRSDKTFKERRGRWESIDHWLRPHFDKDNLSWEPKNKFKNSHLLNIWKFTSLGSKEVKILLH